MFLIVRCAWHRNYFGRPKLIRVKLTRAMKPGWSDGMCRRCLLEMRSQGQLRGKIHERAAALRHEVIQGGAETGRSS